MSSVTKKNKTGKILSAWIEIRQICDKKNQLQINKDE